MGLQCNARASEPFLIGGHARMEAAQVGQCEPCSFREILRARRIDGHNSLRRRELLRGRATGAVAEPEQRIRGGNLW